MFYCFKCTNTSSNSRKFNSATEIKGIFTLLFAVSWVQQTKKLETAAAITKQVQMFQLNSSYSTFLIIINLFAPDLDK